MKTDDRKWIVVRIDGKIAGISTDYRILASISELLAQSGMATDSRTARPAEKAMKGPKYMRKSQQQALGSMKFGNFVRR